MTRFGTLKSGFTLVEVLIYLAILVLVATGAVTFLLSLDELIDQYTIETALYRSGTSVLERVLVEVRQANELDTVNTVINDPDTGVLSLNNDGVNTRFIKSGDELQIMREGVNEGNLMSEEVTVNGFTVYQYDLGDGTLVRVRLTMSATVDGVTKDLTLYGGGIIRGDL